MSVTPPSTPSEKSHRTNDRSKGSGFGGLLRWRSMKTYTFCDWLWGLNFSRSLPLPRLIGYRAQIRAVKPAVLTAVERNARRPGFLVQGLLDLNVTQYKVTHRRLRCGPEVFGVRTTPVLRTLHSENFWLDIAYPHGEWSWRSFSSKVFAFPRKNCVLEWCKSFHAHIVGVHANVKNPNKKKYKKIGSRHLNGLIRKRVSFALRLPPFSS